MKSYYNNLILCNILYKFEIDFYKKYSLSYRINIIDEKNSKIIIWKKITHTPRYLT